MARPILVVKNLDLLRKRIQFAKKEGLDVFGITTPHTKKDRERGDFEVGAKAVRAEYGLPFALLDAIEAQGGTAIAAKVAKVLIAGDRFDPQKLQRLKARATNGGLTDKEFIQRVEAATL